MMNHPARMKIILHFRDISENEEQKSNCKMEKNRFLEPLAFILAMWVEELNKKRETYNNPGDKKSF